MRFAERYAERYAEWTSARGARAILGSIGISPNLGGTANHAKQHT